MKNTRQLISTQTAKTTIRCAALCNQLGKCFTVDYDLVSKRCRLYQGDLTTGSIISSSSTTSVVGFIFVLPTFYSSVYNKSCDLCTNARSATCPASTNRCDCPEYTYWNGTTCGIQLQENDLCQYSAMCRSDQNLECSYDCVGLPLTCQQSSSYSYSKTRSFIRSLNKKRKNKFSIFALLDATYSVKLPYAVTVAGTCNNSNVTAQTTLYNQAGIAVGNNNTLYVGDNGNRVVAFPLNNITGKTLRYFSSWVALMTVDNSTSYVYVTVLPVHIVYIYPTNRTIPPNGIAGSGCSTDSLYFPSAVTVDSSENVYISSMSCHWVTKWAPNTTNSTIIAGVNSGELYAPYGLALDELNGHLYVADRYNNRIQRYSLDGSSIGTTVAGGNGAGSGSNQLNSPIGIYLSKRDRSLYIADRENSRIQKWGQNATKGVTVLGNPSGVAGATRFLLDHPYAVAFDEQEEYLYVSDSWNNRIQRVRII